MGIDMAFYFAFVQHLWRYALGGAALQFPLLCYYFVSREEWDRIAHELVVASDREGREEDLLGVRPRRDVGRDEPGVHPQRSAIVDMI